MNFLSSTYDVEKFEFDHGLYNEIEQMYESNPIIQQNVDILETYMFANISIEKANKIFNDYVEEYFVPFFKSCLKLIFIMGYFPIQLLTINTTMKQSTSMRKYGYLSFHHYRLLR